MKELVVVSGKGGTGKTTLLASMVALAESKVIVDCDVDADDLHLLLQPEEQEQHEFWSGQKAVISDEKCTHCGLCQELCRFHSIREFQVDSISCEGCGFCFNVCHEEAVTMKENQAGNWFVSETKYGPLIHACLGIAQENSGKLVSIVRQKAKSMAENRKLNYILCDGPPGIACPVISAISGADLILIVTEPTTSAVHDMYRVIEVCQYFSVPVVVCINKCDINDSTTQQIKDYCQNNSIKVVAEIPYDDVVTEALVHNLPVVEWTNNRVTKQINLLWEKIQYLLEHSKEVQGANLSV